MANDDEYDNYDNNYNEECNDEFCDNDYNEEEDMHQAKFPEMFNQLMIQLLLSDCGLCLIGRWNMDACRLYHCQLLACKLWKKP